MFRFISIFVLAVSISFLFVGCTSSNPTNTARGITEESLLTIAIERGINKFDATPFAQKKMFIEYDYLAPQVDKATVQGYLELHLAASGVTVSRKAEESDFILQIHSGVLATDFDKFIIGIPSFPFPIPTTDLTFETPEIAIFSRNKRFAAARFGFNVLEAATRNPVAVAPGLNSRSRYVSWSILFIPFTTDNLYVDDDAEKSSQFSMF